MRVSKVKMQIRIRGRQERRGQEIAIFGRRDCPYQIQKFCTKVEQPGAVLL